MVKEPWALGMSPGIRIGMRHDSKERIHDSGHKVIDSESWWGQNLTVKRMDLPQPVSKLGLIELAVSSWLRAG